MLEEDSYQQIWYEVKQRKSTYQKKVAPKEAMQNQNLPFLECRFKRDSIIEKQSPL